MGAHINNPPAALRPTDVNRVHRMLPTRHAHKDRRQRRIAMRGYVKRDQRLDTHTTSSIHLPSYHQKRIIAATSGSKDAHPLAL